MVRRELFNDTDSFVDVGQSLRLLSHCRVHLGTSFRAIPHNQISPTVRRGKESQSCIGNLFMHHIKRRSLLPDWSSCCTQTSSSATSCPTSLSFLHYVLKPVGHNCILPLRVLIRLQFVRGSMSFINTKESATCPCTIQNGVACYPTDRRVVHKLQVGQRRVPRPWLFCTMFWSLLAIIAFCLSVCSFACNLYGGVWVLSKPRSRQPVRAPYKTA